MMYLFIGGGIQLLLFIQPNCFKQSFLKKKRKKKAPLLMGHI